MAENFQCAYDEIVEVHKLQPNPKNPNKHPDRQVEMLAKIIDYQGQRAPIVVSSRSGFITKGHGRLLALQKLGWQNVAVDFQDYENEAQEFADMIADNKIAELAEHDDEMFKVEALNLELDENFDVELFGADDVKFLMPTQQEVALDDVIKKDLEKKYILEVQFPNDMEMMDIHDDLHNRGYIVRVK